MPEDATPESDELGVVDPIRVPDGVLSFARRVRALPPYALGFLFVAIIRTIVEVADWSSATATDLDLGASLVSLVLGVLPGSVVLLIPVTVGWSIQEHGSASKRVIRGSVSFGLSELARVAAAFFGGGDGSTIPAFAALSLSADFLVLGGLIWMAHGLEDLRRIEPKSSDRRAAVVVAALGIAYAAVHIAVGIVLLARNIPGPGSDEADWAIFTAESVTLAHVIAFFGWAYLAWVLIRGRNDPDRPPSGTFAGAVAGWLAGAWFFVSMTALVVVLPWVLGAQSDRGDPPSQGLIGAIGIAAAVCMVGALATLAWAIANGLAKDLISGELQDPDVEAAPVLGDDEAPRWHTSRP